jgi:hypothetical protein
MDSGRHGATAGDEEDRKIAIFHKAMQEFRTYPNNLSQRLTTEKTKFVRDFREHFEQTRNEILLILSENTKGFRRTLIEKKIRIEFHDAGLHDASPTTSTSMAPQARPLITTSSSSVPSMPWEESVASTWASNDDAHSHVVSKSRDLEDTLGISRMAMTPTANPGRSGGNSSPVDQPDFKPRADPVCRFMYVPKLATSNIPAQLLTLVKDSCPQMHPTDGGSTSLKSCS